MKPIKDNKTEGMIGPCGLSQVIYWLLVGELKQKVGASWIEFSINRALIHG